MLVHQIVRDRGGQVLVDQFVQHAYLIEAGRIRSMEILRENPLDPKVDDGDGGPSSR